MNKWTGTGRLTKENELSYSQSGTAYLRNSIAVDRRGDGTDFFNITVFGKTAEAFDKYLKKGSKVVIEGHLQSDSYKDKDGKSHTSVGIIVDAWEFGESKKEDSRSDLDVSGVPAEDLPFS